MVMRGSSRTSSFCVEVTPPASRRTVYVPGSTSGPGDPARAVQAIVGAVESAKPPHRLLLGNAAYELAMAKVADLQREFAAGETVARGADFPKD